MSATADLIYRALTTFGPASAASISDALEMKTKQVCVALDELTALDAVEVSPGHSAHQRPGERIWAGRPASHVVTTLRDRQGRVNADRHRLSAYLSGLKFPSAIGDPAHLPADVARPVHGAERVGARLFELMAVEQREHLIMNPQPAFSAASLKAAAPHNRRLLARGVAVKTLGVPAASHHEGAWHDDELRSNGLAYRELPQLPTKLIITDRTTALVPLDPCDLGRGAWEIDDPGVVEQLVTFFLVRWDQALEPQRIWTFPMDLNPRERAIVTLLASGHTDAGIAAKLDISVRTIAYTISNLMDHYQVTNRFQLGLQLGAEAVRQEMHQADQHNDTEQEPQ